MPPPIENWIVCIQGFLGRENRTSGIVKIQDAIHRKCSGPDTRVLLKHWSDSASVIADRIMQRRPVGQPPRVTLIGHSYGGCTANEIAKELDKRGLKVENMLLLDPVWRPFRWLPSLLSLLPFWKIKVPDNNVGKVYWWHQKTDWPRGHDLIIPKRTMLEKHLVQVNHIYVDDLPQVFDKALYLACPGNL